MARKAAAKRPGRQAAPAAPDASPWAASPADLAAIEAPPPDPLDLAATHLAQGRAGLAVAALLPALDRKAAAGDRECELAAAALRLAPAPVEAAVPAMPLPADALSATLGRLVQLVRQQEEQIRALRELVEDGL